MLLEAIGGRQAPMGFSGPFGRSRRGIAVQHVARSPASQTHEVALPSTGREPFVGEGVTEAVRVEPR